MRKQRHRNKGKIAVLGLGSALVFGNATHAKFDGFYVGASVGYLNQSISLDAKQNPTNVYADINNTSIERGLPIGEIFLGWGNIFKEHFYVGMEGKIDWTMRKNQKLTEDTNFIYLSGRKNPGIAALLRFGYLIKPDMMIYGGIGTKSIQFEHNIFEKLDQISTPFSKRFLNLLTEVGIENSSNLVQNLVFRFSYSLMPKRSMTQEGGSFPKNHIYKRHGIVKNNIGEHIFKIGMLYQF